MEAVYTFLRSNAGKLLMGLVIVGGLVAIGTSVAGFFGSETPDEARYTIFVCAETGKSFRHLNREGEVAPILSPYSKKNTAYIAELCFWNADGTAKKEPTAVLLNRSVGKEGPTFCPECGRLVVGHNPRPNPERKPPPTQGEYQARGAAEN